VTFADKLLLLCPRHRRHGKSARRGFACICEALSEAFHMGHRAKRPRYFEGRR
jgi:hypothetical protein